ncbi:hypothetical protein F383_28227 [Gossypium arboreum]|uniref:Uncharacterized protein n=1 Tax=Gossypium arboreum TaxID=29729 RepID=A0A0B0P514_GOSAR|nr:hypothetical protein F383_28227 [Gossypium arboreum]
MARACVIPVRVVCPCEEVQAMLSSYFGPFLAPFTLLCSPKYKT